MVSKEIIDIKSIVVTVYPCDESRKETRIVVDTSEIRFIIC